MSSFQIHYFNYVSSLKRNFHSQGCWRLNISCMRNRRSREEALTDCVRLKTSNLGTQPCKFLGSPTPLLPRENVIAILLPAHLQKGNHSRLSSWEQKVISQPSCHVFKPSSSDLRASAQAIPSFWDAVPCFSPGWLLPHFQASPERGLL